MNTNYLGNETTIYHLSSGVDITLTEIELVELCTQCDEYYNMESDLSSLKEEYKTEVNSLQEDLDSAQDEAEDLQGEIYKMQEKTCTNCKHWDSKETFCKKINVFFDIGGCRDYWTEIPCQNEGV